MKLGKYIGVIKQKDKNLRTYLLFAFLRILLVFIPQNGYIHPDEFFQSVELAAGESFDLEHIRTWEFNNTFPIRSMAVTYFTIKLPFGVLKIFANYLKYFFQINLLNSYILIVYPRLIMCLLSFVNDWSLHKLCDSYGLNSSVRLLTLGSSFILLVFGSRNFSNTIEMTISSLLLYFVADCMIHSNSVIYKTEFLQERYSKASSTGEKVKFYKMKSALPSHSLNRVFVMATLCVVGIFNRPTFLIFGAPIVFHWLMRGMGSKTITIFDFNLRMIIFCLCALPSVLLFTLMDSLYYMYLTSADIQTKEVGINNFVFTPWNFVKYNIDPENTATHGVHPKYLHLLVNMPLLYNVLGITAIFSFLRLSYRFFKADYKNLPRSQSVMGLMTSAIFAPLLILSLINHQESRFLIPLTLPIIFLHSPILQRRISNGCPFEFKNKFPKIVLNTILYEKISGKFLLKLWYIVNISLVIFYGFVHQGGVIPLTQHFSNFIQQNPNTRIHLVTSHIYNVPLSFMNIPSTKTFQMNQKYSRNKRFFLHEYGSTELEVLFTKVRLLLDVCEMKTMNDKQTYKLFLTIPSSLSNKFESVLYRQNMTLIKYKQIKVFYPHFSTEAPPDLFGKHSCDLHLNENEETCTASENFLDLQYISSTYLLKQFSSIVHQFGLVLYEFKILKIN